VNHKIISFSTLEDSYYPEKNHQYAGKLRHLQAFIEKT